jgi:hypothetical protein
MRSSLINTTLTNALSAFGVVMFAASAMTDRLREYREQFAALTVQAEQRIAKLKGLQEQVKQAKAEQQP